MLWLSRFNTCFFFKYNKTLTEGMCVPCLGKMKRIQERKRKCVLVLKKNPKCIDLSAFGLKFDNKFFSKIIEIQDHWFN